MKNICIAIGGIGGNVASAIARSVKKNGINVTLIGYDMDIYSYGKIYVDKFLVSPAIKDEENFINFLFKMCQEYQVTHIWPVSEEEIMVFKEHRKEFEDRSIQLMINSDDILEIGFSKLKTHMFLDNISGFKGKISPDTKEANLNNIPEYYPVVVKKDFESGSHGMKIIYNKNDYIQYLTRSEGMIYQRYVGSDDEEYTMPIFAHKDVVRSCPMKRRLGLDGMSVRVETVNDKEFKTLNDIAIKIAKAMKLSGCIDVQLRKENGMFYIFEINTRVSSSVGFRSLLGFEDVIWWIQCKSDQPISQYERIQSKLIGRKVLEEVIFLEDGNINAGFGSLKA